MDKNVHLRTGPKWTSHGITLIALIITIIILLILAGITIGTLTGDNSLIKQAGEAKEDAETASEKEAIDNATIDAIGKNKYGDLEEEEFQNSLDSQTGGKAKVTDIGDSFEVYFTNSKRYYEVDGNGNVGDLILGATDPYPGDIMKDENGNTLDGSSTSPYQINCIEDLVAFSNMVNGTGMYFKDGQLTEVSGTTNMEGKYIILTRDLNFKSRASYIDSQRTDFGDINGNDSDGNVLMVEMATGTGFQPIGSTNKTFQGNFDGKNNSIDNIYVNSTRNAGLFGDVNNAVISNLKISGNIYGGESGGLIGYAYNNLTCKSISNECEVEGTGRGTGGIVGYIGNSGKDKVIKLINCENSGNIKGEQTSGGILGHAYAPSNTSYQEVYIYNSYNRGTVESGTRNAGGIIGWLDSDNSGKSNGKIYNCYNIGNVTSKQGKACGIYGLFRSMVDATLEIKNAYLLSDLNLMVGASGWSCLVNGEKISNDNKNAVFLEKSYMKSKDFVEDLNSFEIEGEEFAEWILGEDGYPTLIK